MNVEKPIFKKENVLYEREEKDGYWTFLPKFHPETRELIVNRTSREILGLANGTKTVVEIKDTMVKKYPDVDKNLINNDVDKILSSFSRLRIVEWEGENPYLYKNLEPLDKNWSLMIGQEHDLYNLSNFINSVSANIDTTNYHFVRSPTVHPKQYTEISLRSRLFSFSEEFFLLYDNKKIGGLISIELPNIQNNTSAELKYIVSPKQYFKQFLQYTIDNLPFLSVNYITKIRLSESIKNLFSEDFKNSLKEIGFNLEGTLKDEYGFNNNVNIWSYIYNQNLIEKIIKSRR